ncbi:hypothetical protein DMUE_5933 [Dictyocoela muelleri]|nr:hypothetical protein DMUE_5933 [Dictyocoela muelleri]
MVRPKKSIDEMTYDQFNTYISRKEKVVGLLQENKFLPKKMRCSKCGKIMKLQKYKNVKAGFRWRCNKNCGNTTSVYKNSYFEDCHIDLKKFLKLLFYFYYEINSSEWVIKQLQMSFSTYYYFKKRFESAIVRDYILNKNPIGGKGHEIQIDESLFNRRKYWKGRLKEPIWVFGGIDKGTKECFFHIVNDRSTETLLPLIKMEIKEGSNIVSDCWKSYNQVHKYGFRHFTVNHKKNFVNPETKKHTQNIENLWMIVKKKIHSDYGINRNALQKHFDIFCWKRNLKRTFSEFINLINNY